MKKILFSYLLSLFSILILAQKPDSILSYREKMPEFPGGEAALFSFLDLNMNPTPEKILRECPEGKAMASFVVEKDGRVTEVRIMKPLCPSFDSFCLGVLRFMPNWLPGAQNGNPVRVRMNLPLNLNKGRESWSPINADDKPPEFPGGQKVFTAFLRENTRPLTRNAFKGCPDEFVIANFVVELDGKVTDIQLEQSVCPAIDSAYLIALRKMPNWVPGSHEGQPIRVKKHQGMNFTNRYVAMLEKDGPQLHPFGWAVLLNQAIPLGGFGKNIKPYLALPIIFFSENKRWGFDASMIFSITAKTKKGFSAKGDWPSNFKVSVVESGIGARRKCFSNGAWQTALSFGLSGFGLLASDEKKVQNRAETLPGCLIPYFGFSARRATNPTSLRQNGVYFQTRFHPVFFKKPISGAVFSAGIGVFIFRK